MKKLFIHIFFFLFIIQVIFAKQIEDAKINFKYNDKNLEELINRFREKVNTLTNMLYLTEKFGKDLDNNWIPDLAYWYTPRLRQLKPLVIEISKLSDRITKNLLLADEPDRIQGKKVVTICMQSIKESYGEKLPEDEEIVTTNDPKEFENILPEETNNFPINQISRKSIFDAIVTSQEIIVFTKPTIFSDQLGTINTGQSVRVYQTQLGWSQIEFRNLFGWVEARFLQVFKNQTINLDEKDRASEEELANIKTNLSLPDDAHIKDLNINNVELKKLVIDFRAKASQVIEKLYLPRKYGMDFLGNWKTEELPRTIKSMQEMKPTVIEIRKLFTDISNLIDKASDEDRDKASKILEIYWPMVVSYFVEPDELMKLSKESNIVSGGALSLTTGQYTRKNFGQTNVPDSYLELHSNTPNSGNIKILAQHNNYINLSLFTQSYLGADWSLEKNGNSLNIGGNLQTYYDDNPEITNTLYSGNAGWKGKLTENSNNSFRIYYNNRKYKNNNIFEYSNLSFWGGGNFITAAASELFYEIQDLYQTSNNVYMGFNYFKLYSSYKLPLINSSFNISTQLENYTYLKNPNINLTNYNPWIEIRWSKYETISNYGIRANSFIYPYLDSLTSYAIGTFTDFYSKESDSVSLGLVLYHIFKKLDKTPEFSVFEISAKTNFLNILLTFNSHLSYAKGRKVDSAFWHFTTNYLGLQKTFCNFKDTINFMVFSGITLYINASRIDTTSPYNCLWPAFEMYGSKQLFDHFNFNFRTRLEKRFYFNDDKILNKKRSPYTIMVEGRIGYKVDNSLNLSFLVYYQKLEIDFSPLYFTEYFLKRYSERIQSTSDVKVLFTINYKLGGIIF